jgi:hypothetical protein
VPYAGLVSASWQGSLHDLANIIYQVRRIHAFGRLSLRNTERLSVAHLYFRAGKLVHVVGNRGNVHIILSELQEWTQGIVRFERGVATSDVTLNDEHERLLDEALMRLNRRGVLKLPQLSRVIDSKLIASADAHQLLASWEWQVLLEATRRVSMAVAHLVGPREAMKVLQDILDDCSSAFPAFASLKIASSGYLQVVDRSLLDHMSREEVLEGFTALIASCQYFCSPIIGEREAHQLMVRALQDVVSPLARMGVFRIDNRLLSSGNNT